MKQKLGAKHKTYVHKLSKKVQEGLPPPLPFPLKEGIIRQQIKGMKPGSKDMALRVPMRLKSPAAHQVMRKGGSIRLQQKQLKMLGTELGVPRRIQSSRSTQPSISINVGQNVHVKKRLAELDDSTHIQRERMDHQRGPKFPALAA